MNFRFTDVSADAAIEPPSNVGTTPTVAATAEARTRNFRRETESDTETTFPEKSDNLSNKSFDAGRFARETQNTGRVAPRQERQAS